MNSHTPDLTVFEIKKIIEVNKTMNLLDLNGSKINFQSEFIITAKDSSKNYSATVVNQEELDQGTFNFENSVEGKFTRKVIFQDNKHQNHFVAIKKLSNDRSTDPIICDVVITLQELPSIEQSSLPQDELSTPEIREDLQKEFAKIRNEETNEGGNIFFTFGMICLILFVILVAYKVLKKNTN